MRLPITPVTTLWRGLRDEVRHNLPGGRVIIAVDGIEGAGTAAFADGLADVFAEEGSAVFRTGIDGFLRPRAERFARGAGSPEGYYLDSYDYATFRRVLIDPFREGGQTGGSTGFQLVAFDAARDVSVESQWVTAPRDAVLVVDGLFLHRPELRSLWHWSVWLDVPEQIAFARLAATDGSDPDPAAPVNARRHEGHELYLRDARPQGAASAIVDNADPDHPHREFRDFC